MQNLITKYINIISYLIYLNTILHILSIQYINFILNLFNIEIIFYIYILLYKKQKTKNKIFFVVNIKYKKLYF